MVNIGVEYKNENWVEFESQIWKNASEHSISHYFMTTGQVDEKHGDD